MTEKNSQAQNMPSYQLVPGAKQALLPLLQHVLRVLFKALSTHSLCDLIQPRYSEIYLFLTHTSFPIPPVILRNVSSV